MVLGVGDCTLPYNERVDGSKPRAWILFGSGEISELNTPIYFSSVKSIDPFLYEKGSYEF